MKPLLSLIVFAALALLATLACGGDNAGRAPTTAPAQLTPTPREFPFSTPAPATRRAGVPTGIVSFGETGVPAVPGDAAVYLSLGGSLQYGCCADPQLSSHPLFAQYLSQRLNRPVVWVSLAGNDTAVEFIDGVGGNPPQLDRAVAALQEYRRQGRDVVAITLSIGGNDLLALRTGMGCTGGGRPECIDAFAQLLERYTKQMQLIYSRLNEAKDPRTPILQNNYYDAMDCGRPGDDVSTSAIAIQIFNQPIEGAIRIHGAFLRDFYTAFRRKACEYISGVDPTYAGYDAILAVDKATYEALPSEYVQPFFAP